jgi:rhamnosyltransferase subunit B
MGCLNIQTQVPAGIHTFRHDNLHLGVAMTAAARHKLHRFSHNFHSSDVHPQLMQPRRITLSTLGSLGDLHPVMGLGSGLQARGHHVVLATSELYRNKVETAGLRFSPLRPLTSPDDPQMLEQVLHSRKGPEYLIRTLLMPYLEEMYADLWQATEGADLLISGEVVLAASLVAEKRGMPWASVLLAPFSLFSIYDPPAFPFLPWTQFLTRAPPVAQRLLLEVGKLAIRSWGEPIVRMRRKLGLRASRDPLLFDRFSPHLNLAMFSAVLGQPERDWPANTVQTGFVFYDQDEVAVGQGLEEFLVAGDAPITFTLGSAAVMQPGRFFEESIAAARLLGRRALLLMGKNVPPEGLAGDVLVAEYAPYSRVFHRSAAVVHQGGVGTTAQALRAGVPQLVMPYAFDQPDNAARVRRIGVGLSIGRQRYRAAAAARRLEWMLGGRGTSRDYVARAREIGRLVSGEDGLSVACDTVERALEMLRVTPPRR